MDIITAGRACVRRWYLFIPILVIGILATVHIADKTKPTFEATGSFIVINSAVKPVTPKPSVTHQAPARGKTSATPTPTPKATPQPTTTAQNPYATNQDLLRGALQDVLNGSAFQKRISDAGYKGSFTVAIAKKQPIFNVTAQARHDKQAVALANEVLAQANVALHTTQTQAGAPADSLLNAQTINTADSASNITTGKSKRLVAGVVVTAAAAIALSIGLDSSVLGLRRRRARGDLQPAEGGPIQDPSNTTAFLPGDEPSQTPEGDDPDVQGSNPMRKLSHRRSPK